MKEGGMGCTHSLFPPATLTVNERQLRIGKLLATGGFAEVYVVRDVKSGEALAMKQMRSSSDEERKRIAWEEEVIRLLPLHPNIVPILAASDEESYGGNGMHRMLFPLYELGTWADELVRLREEGKRLEQQEIVRVLRGFFAAIQLMHDRQLAHRDVKPANLLIDGQRNAVLTDFGSACRVPIEISSSADRQKVLDEAGEQCSMPFRAPELFEPRVGGFLTCAVDMWSVGCVIYAFCHRYSPFEQVYERGDSIALAVQSPEKIKYEEEGCPSLHALTRACLTVDPSERTEIITLIQLIDEEKEQKKEKERGEDPEQEKKEE